MLPHYHQQYHTTKNNNILWLHQPQCASSRSADRCSSGASGRCPAYDIPKSCQSSIARSASPLAATPPALPPMLIVDGRSLGSVGRRAAFVRPAAPMRLRSSVAPTILPTATASVVGQKRSRGQDKRRTRPPNLPRTMRRSLSGYAV